MAGKMGNWIEHQRRHLSPADFDAWVKGDVKVQAYLDKQEKIPAAVRALQAVQNEILKKVIAPGLQKASEFLAGIEKADARGLSKTGILAQSIGSTKAKLYPATFCGYVASGPRRGYARVVQIDTNQLAKGKIRLKRLSKKQSLIMTASRKQIPTQYAYYLTKGRKAVQPVTKKALLTAMGRFFSHAKAAPPKDFMESARGQSDQAAAVATNEMNQNLKTLLPGD